MTSSPPPPSRTQQWAALGAQAFDVLVVGAGINGAVTAAAIAARGVRVALVDRGDFASQTSMHSSNLAWGGIKYMEGLEFGLVRKLCRARNALMRAYPTAVQETRFLTTVPQGFRWPRWFLYLGAWLYWFIGSFYTKTPRLLSKRQLSAEQPLINVDSSVGGFEYSDAHLVDGDARFVFGFVRSAIEHGAVVLNYANVENATFDGHLWSAEVLDLAPVNPEGESSTRPLDGRVRLTAKVLINTCGPYADAFNARCGVTTRSRHVLSKGVHLNVRRIAEGNRVLAFFASDGRLFFAIPLGARSCIGTTDTRIDEMPPRTTDEDRQFILDNINTKLRLETPLSHADILAERCGARPLAVSKAAQTASGATDWTALSRKHIVETDAEKRQITIFGGKLTDCLNVGDELVAEVARLGVPLQAAPRAWYGEGSSAERERWLNSSREALPEATAARLWRCYGKRAAIILDLIRETPSLAKPLYPEADVVGAEAVYAGRYECVVTPDDFLRRRTHLAQQLSATVLLAADEHQRTLSLLLGERTEALETGQ